MPAKMISVKLEAELLKIIDEAAKNHYCSRSDYIRQAVILRLKRAKADPEALMD